MLHVLFFALLAGTFLLGMTWMRMGLFHLSGSNMENWLQKFTNSPFMGMLAGIGMTAILQSSSAVTVIAVGLVSARILTFPQTTGIILGTNIGTTVTLEFLTFDLNHLIIPFIIAGILLQFFKNTKLKSCGYIFLGIAIIFAAMNGFEILAKSIEDVPIMQRLIGLMKGNIAISFLTGTFLTAIIQSSTAMTGIAMTFLTSGTFDLNTGIAIMIGANIGTCATALLASIGAGNEARLTAYAHIWLNLAGALLFLPFISVLGHVSSVLSDAPDMQLAHASVLYNTACSLLALPFAKKFGQFIIWLHGK
ncbi:Na/Pi symporter [Lederbergia sp. NSJ-179]|uniref:Na/Pi symporter n=1 Tax=Lederbergia sp. NSJ-179 TaxID=2931402 RepID=UPI001FD10797|nr:Na/Pi symporter [Lederbergia sp. NSJ-179]MCJ7841830.1 Na/Pi symporter [Lederbergia sp. NSJ-179]